MIVHPGACQGIVFDDGQGKAGSCGFAACEYGEAYTRLIGKFAYHNQKQRLRHCQTIPRERENGDSPADCCFRAHGCVISTEIVDPGASQAGGILKKR